MVALCATILSDPLCATLLSDPLGAAFLSYPLGAAFLSYPLCAAFLPDPLCAALMSDTSCRMAMSMQVYLFDGYMGKEINLMYCTDLLQSGNLQENEKNILHESMTIKTPTGGGPLLICMYFSPS